MTSFGTRTRAVAAVLIFLLSPLLFHYASSFAASYPLTALAAFIWLSVAYAKLLEGNDKKKGTNLALLALHCIAVVAVLHTFDSVVYWRQLVTKLLDVKLGKEDPLKALNKVPWLKPLVQGWRENFAIEHAGKYSIVLIVCIELVEFVTQTTNASQLARYLDWKTLGFYVNIIAANSVLFGVCLIVPERFVDESGMVAVDVLIDATYILFNILYVKNIESYWAIIIPLAFAVNTPDKAFKRKAQLKVNDIAAYFKNGITAATVCGFGVDLDPRNDAWELDVSECELEKLGGWNEAFVDLEVLDLSDNELVELPRWLGEGRTGKLRELRARGNKVEAFVDGMLGGVNTTLVEVDLRDNEIVELPYELMNVESKNTVLLFDGNPCAEVVDWSGLGKDRLPARMVGEGYDNGGWNSSLRVLKMGRNELDESVFGELVTANFSNIEELDVSWNALEGIEKEGVRGLEKLRMLDVSGNERISAEDLVAAPEGLEMLNSSFCGVDEIDGGQAVKLQDRNMTLHGNLVTRLEWPYELELKKIPAWLRTLEKITEANLGYCDVKELKGGAFPASLEKLNIKNQGSEGLRLHPDSFEGLPNLWFLEASTNKITEDEMHPGLFAGATSLSELHLEGNPEMRRFNATELFPGGSKIVSLIDLK
ncbi:hypothetical protein TeGR_g11498, partial [Tetraparma gracilis]